jgi:hypothetical protein
MSASRDDGADGHETKDCVWSSVTVTEEVTTEQERSELACICHLFINHRTREM